MRRSLALVLVACLLVLLPRGAVQAAASSTISLRNPQSAALEGEGSSYTLTVPEGEELVSFDLVVSGLSYSADPTVAIVAESDPDGMILRIVPSSVRLTANGTRKVELELTEGNTPRQAALLISVRYDEYSSSLLEPITVRVVQEQATAAQTAAEEQQTVVPADDYALLTDPLNPPEVAISGNVAKLTYRPRQLVSLDGELQSTTLTIHDISRLEANMPLSLGEVGLDLALPATHVNAVLEAKAQQLAEELGGLLLTEVPAPVNEDEEPEEESEEEPGDELPESLWLGPAARLSLDEDVAIYSNEGLVTMDGDGSFRMLVETVLLVEAMERAEDWIVELHLTYKGIPATEPIEIILLPTEMARFPTLAGDAPESKEELPESEETLSDLVMGVDWSELIVGGTVVPVQTYRNGRYTQFLAESLSFTTNIPLGMITNEAVQLDIPQSFTVTATRDDEEYQFLRGVSITQPGSYRIQLQAALMQDGEELSGLYISEFYFRILNEEVGDLPIYTPPQGFVIQSVTVNGSALAEHPNSYYHFQRDGRFRIEIAHRNNPNQVHAVEFVRKTSAPVLLLDGVVSGQSTQGTVRFHANEPDAEITVQRDGETVSGHQGAVNLPGYYSLLVRDKAGNSTQYSFRILYSMNVSAWTSFALLFLLAAGVVGYGLYLRTHMKVR